MMLNLLAALAVSATPSAEKIVAQVQKVYDSTKDFSASFRQDYQMVALSRSQTSTGQVRFRKPGQIRFDYEQPQRKTFAVDGHTLWIFQPEDGQALVDRCFKADGLTASLVFLGGAGKIREQFDVVTQPETDAAFVLVLTPKIAQAAFASITLWVDRKSYEVRASQVTDAAGNPNRFEFSQVKRNGGLTAQQVAFTPPPGVAVNPVPGSCNP